MRVTRAIERMVSSDYSLTEIAFAVGFNNLVTFERTFRKVMGASPSSYRKTMLIHAGIAPAAPSRIVELVPTLVEKAPTDV